MLPLMTRNQQDLAAAADQERLLRIEKAWNAYYGNLPEPLKKTKSDPKGEDNIKLSFGRLIVDLGVSFLFGNDESPTRFEVDGKAASEADTWLADCWSENRLMTTLLKLGINGGVCGHAFLKVTPAKPPRKYPRVVVLDPANVKVEWEPDDYEVAVRYTIQWHGIDPATGKPVARRQRIERDGERWTITDQESRGDQGAWLTVGTPEVWPFPWAPVFGCQNLPAPNEFYGVSDLEADVLNVQNAHNFVASNLARILRIHAHPKTWGRGFDTSELKIGADETFIIANEKGELRNLEMLSDLSSSLEFKRGLKESLHEIARIPEVAAGKVEDLGQLSGLALQILYQPLILKTTTKRLLYGEMLALLSQCLLEMGGKGEHTVTMQWPRILPTDDQGDAETCLLDQQLGVSRDTLLTKRGYDPKVEAEKRKKELQTERELGDRLLRNFDRGQEEEDPEAEAEE